MSEIPVMTDCPFRIGAALRATALNDYNEGYCNNEFRNWNINFALVEAQHNDVVSRKPHIDVAPALTKHSRLVDLVKDQALPMSSYFLIQGIPHPAAVGVTAEVLGAFPIPRFGRPAREDQLPRSEPQGRRG